MSTRVLVTVATAAGVLLLLYPAQELTPQNLTPFPGPMLLLKARSFGLSSIGAILTVTFATMIFSVGIRLRPFTIVLCILGIGAWLFSGFVIAIGAAMSI